MDHDLLRDALTLFCDPATDILRGGSRNIPRLLLSGLRRFDIWLGFLSKRVCANVALVHHSQVCDETEKRDAHHDYEYLACIHC